MRFTLLDELIFARRQAVLRHAIWFVSSLLSIPCQIPIHKKERKEENTQRIASFHLAVSGKKVLTVGVR